MKKKLLPRLKHILVFTGISLILSMLLWPERGTLMSRPKETDIRHKRRVYDFTYNSVDGSKKYYSLKGKKAVNLARKDVELTDAHLEYASSPDHIIHAFSDKAYVHRNEELIRFEGHVRIKHPSGHIMTTPKAFYNMQSKQFYGHDSVKGFGPSGFLEGEGFVIYNNERRFIVKKVNPLRLTRAEVDVS
jgi:LPS export ABC transporter protein LptC